MTSASRFKGSSVNWLNDLSRDLRPTLGIELQKEMARVRDLLPLYDAIPAGVFAATMMRNDLDVAAKALAEGDVVTMIRVYESLKDFTD